MADVIITLKIMPESPETDLEAVKVGAAKLIEEHKAKLEKDEIHPVAFGLKAVHLVFTRNEDLGSTDALEEAIGGVAGVQSVSVISVSRTLG